MNAPRSSDGLLLTKLSIGTPRLFGLPGAVRRASNSSRDFRQTFFGGEKKTFCPPTTARIENTFIKDVFYVLPLNSPDQSTIKYAQHVSIVYEY